MKKIFPAFGTLAALIAAPALIAQTQMPSNTMPMTGTFLSVQANNQWLATKIIGLTVFGPADDEIGSINDLVIDQSGAVQAAVVGGFLRLGAKDVAIALKDLKISRIPDGDKVTVRLSRNELELAPTFQAYTGEPVTPLAPK
jgi:hypothetical protein